MSINCDYKLNLSVSSLLVKKVTGLLYMVIHMHLLFRDLPLITSIKHLSGNHLIVEIGISLKKISGNNKSIESLKTNMCTALHCTMIKTYPPK